jgi:hypothetical protein
MKLLSRNPDFEQMPDELWEFGSQFIVNRGYDLDMDIDSLMLLLWRMEKRIKELEAHNHHH